MSGIYIPGMEMPKSCWDCFACHDGWCIIIQKIEGHRTITHSCPLLAVPDHGRLIDESWLKSAMITTLEALKKNPKMDRQEMHLIAAFDTLRTMVEDAPTIIPADKEEQT